MEQKLHFKSAGLQLCGVLHTPENVGEGERLPVVLAMHGFGSNKDNGACVWAAQILPQWGYAVLRFDMRGCGESEGERGRILCMDQVEDTRSAITMLQGRDDIDPRRVVLLGHSFGAAVAVYAGSIDTRVAAVISSGGWGNGERKFMGQHSAPGAFRRFLDLIEEGRQHRQKTGEPFMMDRYDIVPIPAHLRSNLSAGSHTHFPSETAESMMAFNAEDVVHRMAPRPLLLLHSSRDHVTPTEQSVELFKRAGAPVELHLMAETDHFMFAENNPRVVSIVRDWLDRLVPARP